MTKKELVTPVGKLFYNDHGMLVLESQPNTELTPELYLEMMDTVEEFCEGLKHLFLLIIAEGSSITREARELDTTNRRAKITIAQAVVVNSLPVKILANFFGNSKKLPYPYKVFDTREAATAWLLEQA